MNKIIFNFIAELVNEFNKIILFNNYYLKRCK